MNNKKCKSNIRKTVALSLLSAIMVVPNVVMATGIDYTDNINENVSALGARLSGTTYHEELEELLGRGDSIRQAEIELENQKRETAKLIAKNKFEEKMAELQRLNDELIKKQERLGTLSEKDADSIASSLGLHMGSTGKTSVANDLNKIYQILEKNKDTLSDNQIAIAKKLPEYLGKPYVWAATGPDSYDCSGFTQSIIRNATGTNIARTASDQYLVSQTKIPIDDLQLGDLVFFERTGGRRGITHVGMYIGDGVMVHASSSYDSVRTENVFGGYFSGKYVGAARYI